MASVRRIVVGVLVPLAAALLMPSPCFAGIYDAAANNGVTWLNQQRNLDDGSWGGDSDKYVITSEAVLALAALNRYNAAYFGGVSWLGNHAPTNVDFTSRRVLALGPASSSVSADLLALQGAQGLAGPGNNGWGMTINYLGSPIDTSLSLQALTQQSVTTNVAAAVSYLAGAQLTGADNGWAVGRETTSDPITTAQVLIALAPLQSTNTSIPSALARGVTTLNARVNSTSPVAQIALAAIANLRYNPASPQASTLLAALVGQQANDGSWEDDGYSTALALRALAAGSAKDLAAQKQIVNLPDAALRNVVNAALGQSALDAITVGQMQLLTSLDASNQGIADLTGLQYATNAGTLNLSNNNIASFAPVASLTSTRINESGNPGSPTQGTNVAVPSLPDWAAIAFAGLLLLHVRRSQQRRN
jgi:hypothetical protein